MQKSLPFSALFLLLYYNSTSCLTNHYSAPQSDKKESMHSESTIPQKKEKTHDQADSLFMRMQTLVSKRKYFPTPFYKNSFGDLVLFISLYFNKTSSEYLDENHPVDFTKRFDKDKFEAFLSSVTNHQVPHLTKESFLEELHEEILAQITRADKTDQQKILSILGGALSGVLKYKHQTQFPFLLTFIRTSKHSEQTKVSLIVSATNSLLPRALITEFITELTRSDSLKSFKKKLSIYSFHHLHELLFFLEMHGEPESMKLLRARDALSNQTDKERRTALRSLQDSRVEQVRNSIIMRLADTIIPTISNKEFCILTSMSSLSANTVAEVLFSAFEKYPALLHEFVSITTINRRRQIFGEEALIAFTPYNNRKPVLRLLRNRSNSVCQHLETEKLYRALTYEITSYYC